MKAIKSRFLLALTSVAMVICLCIGITACKKDKGGDKETFPAPSNVVIVGDMLRWDAVDGAAEYTVKINANETASASTNSLDLTAVTSKLVSGENTLCVRVNATDDKNESAYSQAVTYTYSPVTQLATPAGLAVNGTTLSWNAVTGATNGYTVKIGAQTLSVNATELDLTSDEAKAVLVRGENSISVKANATSTLTESAYSDPVTYDYSITPAEEAAEFRTAVEAIGDVTADSEAAIAQARAKYDVLSAEAKQVEGVDGVIDVLAQKECDYFAVLVNAVETVDVNLTVADKEAVDTAIEKADAYYAELIDNTKAAATKATLEGRRTAYETLLAEITEELTGLKETIEAMNLGGDITQDKVTVDYYKELKDLKQTIAGFGGYVSSLWNAENSALTAAVDKEIENLLKTPAQVEDGVEIFFNAVNGKVTVLCKAVNVLGETIVGNAPSLSLTTYAADTVTHQASFIGKDGVYYYTSGNIVVEEAKGSTEAADDYQLKVVYTIGGEQEKTVIFKKIKNDIYFDNNKDFNAVVDDTIHFAGAPGFEAYFDIYETGAISLGTGDNTIPTVTGFPLIKEVPVKNDMSVEAFRAYLAREYGDLLIGKEYEVRFVLYLTEKTEDGAITISNIKNDLVSHDTYTLDLTEEDKKERLFIGNGGEGVWGSSTTDPGLYEFGARISMSELKKQLFGTEDGVTNAQVCKELCYVVSVTLDGVTKEFTTDFTGEGIPSAILKRNIYNLFKQDEATGYTISIRFAPKESSVYIETFKDSNPIPARPWNFTATLADTRLNIAGALSGGSGKWGLGDKNVNTQHSWEVSTTNTAQYKDADLHDGVNIYAYLVGEKDVQTYDFFANDKPFASYTHRDFAFAKWSDIDAAILESVLELGKNKPENATFVFVMQWIANEKAISLGYSDSIGLYATADDGSVDTKSYTWDWTVPNALQIGLDANNNVIFLQGFTVEKALIAGYASHVEIRFATQADASEYYTAYIVYDSDNAQIVVRTSLDGTEGAALVHGGNEYWTGAGQINTLLSGLASGFDITQSGWYFQTKVVANENTDYYTSGDGLSGWVALK